ncbi:MAG: hypothetical protein JWR38_3271 [Mucilaginibacter sp.]|nr:hypothetical protein [Mucilaginibacter sp.]
MKHDTVKLSVMKSIIPVLILCLLVCNSCKKDHSNNTTPDSKSYTVTFKLSGFSQTDTVFEAGKRVINGVKSVNDVITPSIADVLYCNVYDANGKFVSSTKQLSTYLTFGTISFGALPGNYTVVFAAGKTGLIIDKKAAANVNSLNDDFLRYSTIPPGGNEDNTIKDTFYRRVSITVDKDYNQNIVLDRIVAQVLVTIEDELPPNVISTSLVVNPVINAYPVNGDKPFTNTATKQNQVVVPIPQSQLGTSNYIAKTLIFTDGSPFTLTIFAYPVKKINDSTIGLNNTYFAKKDVTGVTAAANKTTVVTGKLFENYHSDGGFHISINPDWNPTPVTVPF